MAHPIEERAEPCTPRGLCSFLDLFFRANDGPAGAFGVIPVPDATRPVSGGDLPVDAQLKRVVERVYDLPSFPLVIKKLVEVAENPKSSSKDLAKVMETDQGLSTKILKLVNSAFYGFPRPVSSLQHAITLVGYNSVRSLAMSVSVKNIFRDQAKGFNQERFWEHSLASALAARTVAEAGGSAIRDDVFTAALLHDVGVLLEARYFADELGQAIAAVRERGISQSEAEEEVLGVDHCLLGAWLAEKWRLPPTLRESMLRHHEFEDGDAVANSDLDKESKYFVQIVTLANQIARGMGYYTTRTEPVAEPTLNFEVSEHLTPLLAGHSVPEIATKVHEAFDASREFLAI